MRVLGIESSCGETAAAVVDAGRGWHLFHFLGTLAGGVLAAALARASGARTSLPGALALGWAGADPSRLPPPDAALLDQVVRARKVRLARQMGSGPFAHAVPRAITERMAVAALAPARLTADLADWRVLVDVPKELARTLWELRRR